MRLKLVIAIYVAVFAGLSGTIGATLKIHELQAGQWHQQFVAARTGQQAERARERAEQRADAEIAELKAERDAAFQASADKDAQLQQKDERIKNLEQQVALKAYSVAVVGLGGGGPSTAAPAIFPYGYCTWYVASRRQVTWGGNAINWWANASGIRPEGQMPQVGAIMVSRESWWGHVAYVESVTSASVFTVAEMNYLGWGLVDRRVVNRAVVPVVGFIY